MRNCASAAQIAEHLTLCDVDFVPTLSSRVEIRDYAQKLASQATTFEAWLGDTLIGLVAAYCNNHEQCIAYISSVSVLKTRTGKGIADSLVNQCIFYARASGMQRISLKVAGDNGPAIALYRKNGFAAISDSAPLIEMNLTLKMP